MLVFHVYWVLPLPWLFQTCLFSLSILAMGRWYIWYISNIWNIHFQFIGIKFFFFYRMMDNSYKIKNKKKSMRGRHSIMILGWNVNVLQIDFIRVKFAVMSRKSSVWSIREARLPQISQKYCSRLFFTSVLDRYGWIS